MANYATLKAAIAAAIKQNGNNEITGNLLQQQLLAMVNSLGVGYQYVGIATPATNPGTPDQNVFYIASTAGTYTNFSGFVLDDGEIAILKYNGAWSKDSTGAASAAQLNQLGQQMIGADFLNGEKVSAYGYIGFVNNSGTISENENYNHSDYIPVTGNDFIEVRTAMSGGGALVAFYGDKNESSFISSVPGIGDGTHPVTIVVNVPATAKYARFTAAVVSKSDSYFLSLVKNKNKDTEEYVKSSLDSSIIDINEVKDITLKGFFLINNNGGLSANDDYAVTSYIRVVENKIIEINSQCSGGAAVCCFYDDNKDFISSIAGVLALNLYSIKVPAGAVFMRVTTLLTALSSFFVRYAGNDLNTKYNERISSIQGKQVATATMQTLDTGLNIHSFPQTLKKGHVLTFEAEIGNGGFGNGFYIGFGYGGAASAFIKVTPTLIQMESAIDGIRGYVEHGISNFNTFVKIVITSLNDGRCKIYLQTLNESYGGVFNYWGWDFNGLPHVYPLENSNFVNAKFSVGNTDLKKSIWAFGDSYWNYWPGGLSYQFYQWGYQNFCMAARGGQDSAGAFEELGKMLKFGRPKYIIWSLGMNDSYSDWLSYFTQVRNICDTLGIEMIPTTIPTGKNSIISEKQQMTDYVRSCGLRYVDIYKALGCNANGEWYNDGQSNDFQQPDGIHMSAYAAPYACEQYLVDFPEIMQYNNVDK